MESRNEPTRDALIEAAIEAFGETGYHGTGTRAIARAAGANQAMIGYHFGGKEGLYRAALERIADGMESYLGPVAAAVNEGLDALDTDAGLEDADRFERGVALAGRMTDALAVMMTSDASARWARLIVREQQDPSDAFDVLQERAMGRWGGVLIRIVEAATGLTPLEARLTAITILGQVLVFRVARSSVLRLIGWSGIGDDELPRLQRRIRIHVRAVLDAGRREALSGGDPP